MEPNHSTLTIMKSMSLRMAQYIKASGKKSKDMDLESKLGLTELDMRVSGLTTKLTATEFFIMLMETFSMATGRLTKQMATALTIM